MTNKKQKKPAFQVLNFSNFISSPSQKPFSHRTAGTKKHALFLLEKPTCWGSNFGPCFRILLYELPLWGQCSILGRLRFIPGLDGNCSDRRCSVKKIWLFKQHNEHRIAIPKLFLSVFYFWVHGINFRNLALSGDLYVLVIFNLLLVMSRLFRCHIFLALPLALIVFNPQN